MKADVTVVLLPLTLFSVDICTITLYTRMKEINEQRKRMAEEEEKTVEKGEKWKHDHKQERGMKQNPRDALKRKVCYVTPCENKDW